MRGYSPQTKLEEVANRIFNEMNVGCNCGGPELGTACAPDCSLVLAQDDALAQARDELWEQKQESEATDA